MAQQKRLKIRTGARTASKVQERELISKAKKILKNSDLCIPRCEHEGRCVLDKTRKQIKKVQNAAEDPKKLARFAKRGDQLARAYAATLLLVQSEKAPYLAVLRTPFGEIAYAMRGKVKKEKLIGVQHYDKPKWRLLSVMDLARKKGLHIYSTDRGLVCMGKEAEPPDYFIEDMLGSLKYRLRNDGDIYSCEHISIEDVKDRKASSDSFILVGWKPADINIAVCSRCVDKKSNILTSINQKMAVPKPEKDFDVDVITAMECEADCEDCSVKKHMDVDQELLDKYFNGTTSDRGLLNRHLESYEDFLKASDRKIFILDQVCFSEDLKAFLDALDPTNEERKGLEAVLSRYDRPVVVSKATPNKLLSMFWEDYGKYALEAIVGDGETAGRLFNEADTTKSSPSHILREAAILTRERDIISALPDYKYLPPIAKFADNIARIYLTQGKEDAVRAVEHYKGGDTRIKSVAYSFLLALEQGASKKWQYTGTEIDFAKFLKEPALKLLHSTPEDYHDNLQNLLSATGSTKKLELD